MGTGLNTSVSSEATIRHLEQLALLLDAHGLTHLEYSENKTHVLLKKELTSQAASSQMAPPSPSPAFSPPAPPLYAHAFAQEAHDAPAARDDKLISAPLLGVAYRAKEPGARPFVEVGSQVEKGTVLCLIEAMKMFNEVKAPCSGIVQIVHMADGALVEFGAPLFSLKALPTAQDGQGRHDAPATQAVPDAPAGQATPATQAAPDMPAALDAPATLTPQATRPS